MTFRGKDIEAVFELRRTDEIWASNYDEFDHLNDPLREWTSIHMSPLELIEECKKLAVFAYELSSNGYLDGGEKEIDHLSRVIAECQGWENTFDEFNQV